MKRRICATSTPTCPDLPFIACDDLSARKLRHPQPAAPPPLLTIRHVRRLRVLPRRHARAQFVDVVAVLVGPAHLPAAADALLR